MCGLTYEIEAVRDNISLTGRVIADSAGQIRGDAAVVGTVGTKQKITAPTHREIGKSDH